MPLIRHTAPALALAVAAFMATFSSAATLQTNRFTAGPEGWTSGGATVTVEPDGGPAGVGDSFLRVQPGFANLAAFNSSPSWIGDYTTIHATRVEADLMAGAGTSPLSIRLVLFGPGTQPPTTATTQYTSTVAAEIPADGQWRRVHFSLAETDLTRVRGTEPHNALMANVLRVMLRHDPGTPSSGGTNVNGDLGIDNIALRGPAISPGDHNGDQAIDGRDFLVWQRGESSQPLSPADLAAWEANYGQVASTLRLVPEPATGAGLAWLAFIWRRSRLARGRWSSAEPPRYVS